MPVGPGRYRVKTTPSGKKVRLHFTPKGEVNEAKSITPKRPVKLLNMGSPGRKDK